jgi:hypothetical protein
MMESDTEELTGKISSLSMTGSASTSDSLFSTVTLPTTENNVLSIQNKDVNGCGSRLSIDSMVVGDGPNVSRPSFDGHTYCGELAQHIYGHNSPRVCGSSIGRPPKKVSSNNHHNSTSMESVHNNITSIGGIARCSRTPKSTDNPCFVTTYVYISSDSKTTT